MNNPQRAETGPMQFGQDWNGIFIRGGNAGYMAFELKHLLKAMEELLETRNVDLFVSKIGGPISGPVHSLNMVIDCLSSSHQDATGVTVQHMKPFAECFERSSGGKQ
jgi:hypothetical protein